MRPRFAAAVLLASALVTASCAREGSEAPGTTTVTSTTATTSTTSATTSTTAVAADPNGIVDGLYTGEVHLQGDPGTPVYEVLGSRAALNVTRDEVRADIEITTRVSIRASGEEPMCIATLARRYHGRAAPADPLNIVMELRGQDVISLEGPQCGVVAGVHDRSAADDLAIEFAEDRPHPMRGYFRDGRFSGTILGVLVVTAALDG